MDDIGPQIVIQSSNMEQANSAPPPLYENAVNAPSADMPPSYDSLTLMNKLKKAKEDSNNPVEYLTSACAIVCGSFVITVIFAVSIAMPVTMIVIGALYKDDCRAQKFIPIWLIVAGSFGCFSTITRTISNCHSLIMKRDGLENNDTENTKVNKKSCLASLIELFLFAWFIAGNVWVYSIRETVSYDSESDLYCHKTCYLFSFWLITISWIMAVFFCCCCCCIVTVAGCGIGIAGAINK